MNPYAYVFDRYRRQYEASAIGDASRVRAPGEPGLVSIVLPVYNGERYVRAAIESVLAQTYDRFELIIVDDGSTDGTRAILDDLAGGDERIRLIRQENQKLPRALTRGFRTARGEFLTWTSADNTLRPECLETLVADLRAHPDRDAVYANLDIIGDDGTPLANSRWFAGYQTPAGSEHVYLPTDVSDLNIWPNNYVGAAFMYRAHVPCLVGDYSPHLFGLEDYDFWMRVNAALRLRHSEWLSPIYNYRFHDDSLTARDDELRITTRRQSLMVFEEFRRDLLLGPVLWCVTATPDRSVVAQQVLKRLRDAGRNVVSKDRLHQLCLPSLWCPVIHLHVGSAGEGFSGPDCHGPPGILRVLMVEEDELPADLDPEWDLALAPHHVGHAPQTARAWQGWLSCDDVGPLLQAAELRCKADQFARIEAEIHNPPKPSLAASIIVCTRRRADSLEHTLEALLAQRDVSGVAREIIVVNNDPDDLSVEAAVSKLGEGRPPGANPLVRVIDCPFTGLSFARNFGIAAARGEILCFLDDDSVPDRGWLAGTLAAFGDHPEVGIVGGVIRVALPDRPPSWLDPDWLVYWSHFDPVDKKYQSVDQYWDQPYGANWSCRRRAIVEAGGFRTRYGRKGNDFGGGEEMIAGCLVRALGYGVGIEPRSVVSHVVDPQRFTLHHVKRTIRAGLRVNRQSEADLYFHSGTTMRLEISRTLRRAWRSLAHASQAERSREWAYALGHWENVRRQLSDQWQRMRRPLSTR